MKTLTKTSFVKVSADKLNGYVRMNKGVIEVNVPLGGWIEYDHSLDNGIVDVLNDGVMENGYSLPKSGSVWQFCNPMRLFLSEIAHINGEVY